MLVIHKVYSERREAQAVSKKLKDKGLVHEPWVIESNAGHYLVCLFEHADKKIIDKAIETYWKRGVQAFVLSEDK